MTLARLIVVLLLGAFAVSGGKAQDQPKGIALVLSGGGARGLAQIGTLRTLERNGIVPDYVVGTSIGAIVGGLYSAGYTPNELDSIMRSVPWDDVLSISDDTRREVLDFYQKIDDDRSLLTLRFRGTELVVPTAIGGSARFAAMLQDILWRAPLNTVSNFDSLRTSFRAIATNLGDGTLYPISDGNLATALRASATFPLRYAPVELDTALLVDGGLVANIPTEAATAFTPASIVVVNTTAPLAQRSQLTTPWAVADQALTSAMRQRDSLQLALADVVITPRLGEFGTFDFAAAADIIARGDQASKLSPATLTSLRGFNASTGIDSNEVLSYLDGLPNLIMALAFDADSSLLKGATLDALRDASGRSWSAAFRRSFRISVQRALHADGHHFATIRHMRYDADERRLHVSLDRGILVDVVPDVRRPIPRDDAMRELGLPLGRPLNVEQLSAAVERLRASEQYADVDVRVEHAANGGVRLVVGGIDRGSTVLRLGARIDNERNTQGGLTLSSRDPFGLGIVAGTRLAGGQRNVSFEAGLDVPRIAGTEWTASLKGYTSFRNIYIYGPAPTSTVTRPERLRIGEFSEDRNGVRLGAGRQIERAGIVLGEFRYEQQRWRNTRSENAPAFQSLATVRGLIRWDDRDRPQLGRTGRMVDISVETSVLPLSNDVSFSRLILNYKGNLAVGPFVIAPSLLVGSADRTLPLAELFSIGGQDLFFGMREDEERGRQIVVGQLEARLRSPFDLFFETWLSVRYDIGHVWAQPENIRIADMQHGLGATVAVDTPVGPVAISVGRRFVFLDNPPRVALGPFLAYFGIGLRL